MGFIKGLFSLGHKSKESDSSNWYFTRTKDKKIAQFVLSAPVSSITETEFGTIMLPAHNYPILCSEEWCSGLLRMSEKPQPYHMIRTGEFAEEIKLYDVSVAFSFCRMSTYSLFLLDARIESEKLTNKVRSKYPIVPPLTKPIAEWIVGAGDEYSRKMIADVVNSDRYKIIVAENGNFTNHIYMPNGTVKESIGPAANHERVVLLDNNIKEMMQKEFELFMEHHNSIPKSVLDFREAQQELTTLMPLDKDPVFARK